MVDPLKKRLVFSAIFVSLAIYTMFFAPMWLYFCVVWIFSMIALNEFAEMVKKKHPTVNKPAMLLIGACLPFSVLFSAEGAFLALSCLAVFLLYFKPGLRENSLVGIGITFLGIVYVPWFFSHLIKIRLLDAGAYWVFYVILLVKAGDAGAYFVGKNKGKTKLIEHISPNKSVEGAWGGLATTVILSVISKIYLPQAPLGHLILLGILIGVVAQLGDLSESLLKRDAGIKDSGQLPGLGGILDILDSLLLTVPFAFYYIYLFQIY